MASPPTRSRTCTRWPGQTLPLSVLADVLRGGAAVAASAGCLVVGGHTIDDPEPKYGMAVVGLASSPDALVAELGRRGAAIAVVIGRVTSGQAGHIEVRP